ncbi:MAG TPA: HAMP domain-containing sensor histidine kinase [Gemmatimonadaceae bacterium]|nr:HAMP domain-containing sensor histidine kinase [Gemmatimonadaceae bacterium]
MISESREQRRAGARRDDSRSSSSEARESSSSLLRLRRRLTAWYVGTFALVLLTLGVLLLVALTRFVAGDLDASLRAASKEIALATERREREAAATGGSAIDAVEELRIPGRELFLFDTAGRPLVPAEAAPEIVRAAARTAREGAVDDRIKLPPDRTLQLHAERFATSSGHRYVALALADRDALDDRYASLTVLLAALGAVGLVLVAAGGWILARQSVAPVQRSMEQMRRFVADAAHELRTPVAVLRTRADVALQRERSSVEYVAALEALGRETERLSGIVDDLFTLTRADAGERPLHTARVQLDELVLDAVSATGALAERQGVALSVGAADEVVLEADAALLRQLVVILLDNAIKFSERGGAVRVDLHTSPGVATLTVRDTGAGIPPDELPHVFDRFYRGESARGNTSGAGLGLSIAQWITTAHRARIGIASAPGEGTTMTVLFPIA